MMIMMMVYVMYFKWFVLEATRRRCMGRLGQAKHMRPGWHNLRGVLTS